MVERQLTLACRQSFAAVGGYHLYLKDTELLSEFN